jgi:hypothetical protein
MKNINKNNIILMLLLTLLTLSIGFFISQAQQVEQPIAQEPIFAPRVLPTLPHPGLKYGDFWHFLDRWGEGIHNFFTFNPEAKAVLQTRFTLERIAEIDALLREKGVEAPGLVWTQERIQRHMKRVNEILEEQRARGREVAQLAKRLETDFDVRRELLENIFVSEQARLQDRIKEKKVGLRENRLIGNFEKVAKLRVQIKDINTLKIQLDTHKDNLMAMLEIEEKKMELKMAAAERELDILEDKMEELFDDKQEKFEEYFEKKRRNLQLQERTLELKLRAAMLAEDNTLVKKIKGQLLALQAQEEILESKEEEEKTILEKKEEQIRAIVEIREKVLEQIEAVTEEILDITEEIIEMEADGIIRQTPSAVLDLIEQAQQKLDIANQTFEAGNYVRALGQAITAEKLIIRAEKILQDKIEELEEKEELEVEGLNISFNKVASSAMSGHRERKIYVIREENEWDLLQKIVHIRLPEVDFTQYMVIAAFQGEKPTSGYSIEITDIVEYPHYVKVYITETSPRPDEMVIMVLTQPTHIVKLEHIDKEIIFELEEIEEDE